MQYAFARKNCRLNTGSTLYIALAGSLSFSLLNDRIAIDKNAKHMWPPFILLPGKKRTIFSPVQKYCIYAAGKSVNPVTHTLFLLNIFPFYDMIL